MAIFKLPSLKQSSSAPKDCEKQSTSLPVLKRTYKLAAVCWTLGNEQVGYGSACFLHITSCDSKEIIDIDSIAIQAHTGEVIVSAAHCVGCSQPWSYSVDLVKTAYGEEVVVHRRIVNFVDEFRKSMDDQYAELQKASKAMRDYYDMQYNENVKLVWIIMGLLMLFLLGVNWLSEHSMKRDIAIEQAKIDAFEKFVERAKAGLQVVGRGI